jgi:hypothetical protein
MKILAYDIVYDIDEEDGVVQDLPTSFEFDNVEDIDDIADMISDETGWCVMSFKHKVK